MNNKLYEVRDSVTYFLLFIGTEKEVDLWLAEHSEKDVTYIIVEKNF